MKRTSLTLAIVALLALAGCKGEAPATDGATGSGGPPVTEKVFDLEGTIVSRDTAASTLKIHHKAIGDWMESMTMVFPVRGMEFASLPADGANITAKVHVASTGDFWVTDVAEIPGEPTGEAPPTDTSDTTSTAEEISL